MRKLILAAAAMGAVWLAGMMLHHLTLILAIGWAATLAMSTSNTAKARATETRVAQLVAEGIPTAIADSLQAFTNGPVSFASSVTCATLATAGTVTVGTTCGVSGNLFVTGNSNLTGTLTTGNTVGVNGNLFVTGNAALEGSTVTISGVTTTYGALGVNGNINYTGTLNHV
jgi:hypothetical protein